jgi:hypothetical protein
MNMPFDSFHIDSSEYDFYMSLPEDEKLLFLYDLICTDYYDSEISDFPSIGQESFSTNINSNSYREVISKVLDQAIDYNSQVNVIFINELVIFNSYSRKYMAYAILDMSLEGVILDKISIPENLISVFKKQEYCEVYKVLDIANPIVPKDNV